MEPPAIHHAAVLVSDLALAERFYAGALGLRVAKRWEEADGSPRSVWLELGGGAFLALEKAEPGALRAPKAPGLYCLALAIRPGARASLRARLASLGHPVERESPYTLYVRDPDGALVGLSHYPEPEPLPEREPAA